MQFYLAPMEGITGYIYRRAQHACFPSFDKYFTPFIAPKQDKTLNAKERRDILPENNTGMYVVPQILTNRAEDFLRTAQELAAYGYREINLNLGCPSATVVTKTKGAGLLGDTDRLNRLLDGICGKTELDISVKTRLGMYEAEELEELLELYDSYPIKELIIHARVREDYYGGKPDLDAFEKALAHSAHPVIYNGDLFDVERIQAFSRRFPAVDKVMLGRGALANPALIRQAEGGKALSREELGTFLALLVQEYSAVYSGEKDVLFRMKELWFYLAWLLEGPPGESFLEKGDVSKQLKKLRKSQRLSEYEEAVRCLLKMYPA